LKTAILCFPYISETDRGIQYPTGLYKIATFCKNDYKVIVLDQRIHPNIVPTISKIIKDNDNVLCLGLSVMTGDQITSAISISKEMHKLVKIVWGGLHPTILPRQVIENDFVDFAIIGEGEAAFLNLLKYLDKQNFNKQLFLSNNNNNLKHNYINNINNVAFVDFEKYPIFKEYFVKRDGFKRAFTLETSRGCPHNCFFCHNSAHKSPYRFISAKKVIEIINSLTMNYEFDGLIFQEDNFFANKRRVMGILNYLKTQGNIGWKANSRIDYFIKFINDQKFMENLIRSGCKVLQFGIESGSKKILEMINKRININDVIDINKRLSNYPISIRYNFMIGFPKETDKDLADTFKLMKKLSKDNQNVEPPFLNIYTPYPGTQLYNEALRCGFKEPNKLEEWSKFIWNKASADWLSEESKKYLQEKSKEYWEASKYLK